MIFSCSKTGLRPLSYTKKEQKTLHLQEITRQTLFTEKYDFINLQLNTISLNLHRSVIIIIHKQYICKECVKITGQTLLREKYDFINLLNTVRLNLHKSKIITIHKYKTTTTTHQVLKALTAYSPNFQTPELAKREKKLRRESTSRPYDGDDATIISGAAFTS